LKKKLHIFWFRRDLRLEDNVGLYQALQQGIPVLPIFIFDSNILETLSKRDARVHFIYNRIQLIKKQLEQLGSTLCVYQGTPEAVFESLITTYTLSGVYTNSDYEPYALRRDQQVELLLSKQHIPFKTYKDQVIFETNEVVKDDGKPYVVYTPYKRKWLHLLQVDQDLNTYTIAAVKQCLIAKKEIQISEISLKQLGFLPTNIQVPDSVVNTTLIVHYETTRNFPGIAQGTSKLGPHLRFGTISIRKLVQQALKSDNGTFLSQLIWREFFMQILWHFPHTVNKAFKPKYDRIDWRNDVNEFKKWCAGQTGYALVDAGMRELNATGYMHNRVRMLVASFLCKHLLIDWRWGEAYFAEKLLDYELSANVGNWQWAAGSGVDAAPYFRIFNPITQVEKFDKQKIYINRWVPELQELTYPLMMVDHKMARERCLKAYKEALNN